ncbi:MAG: hypothetical protein IJU78_06180, partial [Clostridia bacterium]|nr:hypothetical protein [Clostridia bacterium]
IDTFVNSLHLFDDRLVITYNFKGGTETITLKDIEAAYGSDLNAMSPQNGHCTNTYFFFKGGFAVLVCCNVNTKTEGQGFAP